MISIRRRRLPLLSGAAYPNIGGVFVAASTQKASITDNASLSMGAGVDMTVAGWVNMGVISTFPTILTKGQGFSGGLEYELYINSNGSIVFNARNTANTTNTAVTTATGLVTLSAWAFLVGRYDGTNLSASVNAGTLANTAYTGDVIDSTGDFGFSSVSSLGGARVTGTLDCWGVWKSALGGGGALSTAQISALYNGGVGMAYQDLTASLKTGLVAYWNFDNNWNDSQGANNLTPTNGPTFGPGKR